MVRWTTANDAADKTIISAVVSSFSYLSEREKYVISTQPLEEENFEVKSSERLLQQSWMNRGDQVRADLYWWCTEIMMQFEVSAFHSYNKNVGFHCGAQLLTVDFMISFPWDMNKRGLFLCIYSVVLVSVSLSLSIFIFSPFYFTFLFIFIVHLLKNLLSFLLFMLKYNGLKQKITKYQFTLNPSA